MVIFRIMKISLLQIDSGDDKDANFRKTQKYIIEAAEQKADIICLSEIFLYQGDNEEKRVEKLSSHYVVAFQELAKTQKINLILGSILLIDESAHKPTNTCLIINRKGEIVYRYDKKYMYDVERDDLTYRESDVIQPGSKIGFFELDNIKMGVGICVDLRYPEYFRELAKKGAEIVFLPSNFRKVTGQLAWDVLTKARAIENQIYFCACGQTGGTGAKERCGNSRILSFDGNIISEIGEDEGIVTADIDLESLREFRKEFPVLKQIEII